MNDIVLGVGFEESLLKLSQATTDDIGYCEVKLRLTEYLPEQKSNFKCSCVNI